MRSIFKFQGWEFDQKKLQNLNATPSPVPLCPSIQTLLPALLHSILNQIFAFGMPFTMN